MAAKFKKEKLRDHCLELFGCSTCTFDGAMYNHQGEFTKKQATEIISKWLTKEVE